MVGGATTEVVEVVMNQIPDLGTLKGKTTRRKPTPVVSDQVEAPQEIYSNNDAFFAVPC